jgi:hypothetical protein
MKHLKQTAAVAPPTKITQTQDQNTHKEYKSFYKTIDSSHASMCMYPTRLDTYGCGCAHDCKYCYAKSQLEFRKLWDPNDPRVADITKIEKKDTKDSRRLNRKVGRHD